MNQETWQSVCPQYDQYQSTIDAFETLTPCSFMSLQRRFSQALKTFAMPSQARKQGGVSRILLVNAPDNPVYFNEVVQQVCLSTQDDVVASSSLDSFDIFGSYRVTESGDIVHSKGVIEQIESGVLVLSANFLLANPQQWLTAKALVLGKEISPLCSDRRFGKESAPRRSRDMKLVIVGDRNQFADLEYLDDEIHSGLALFSELELEINLSETSIALYLGFLRWLQESYHLPKLESDAIHTLMISGARETEDQRYMPLGLLWHVSLLEEASLRGNGSVITAEDIEGVIQDRLYRESYLPDRALSDIRDGQVIIETEGEQVGQVNGLTVIDVPGHPRAYGEPARISCVIHFGDGDISDVERKADLGGNLHAKGMMIMQAFVSSALQLEEPLPYSASLVFEQSYCEVDGDSASLAELCCFVSALSDCPINQQIAVTGAVDQFGRVQAVGGLNEKIEGFYHVCQHQGFTGHQGVILPKSNLKHLALNRDVVESIRKGEFHIWSVSSVDEAVPILMNIPFRQDEKAQEQAAGSELDESNSEQETVLGKIAERIEAFDRHSHPLSLFERLRSWF
ncbi:Lon protease family protein [Vibrio agarivorans]|uniref:Lon protease family protein n=1 Tax=Vibrio agarivorans TaxID=153622 RepID=UPI0025B30871|nr:Lon protease family protein [Vibrio agarivorans]MDN3663310.1 Lon protease family protein [Vibrio agarivorans]